ncbi:MULTISPECIES: serine hydrolase [Pseudomonas]|uniref:serine hydrolase domain-containing protein n=1 Tax=Pseudomonas TaxID=286 RepID=UPI001CFC26AC|nr:MULTISPECIES: serine hydrolase [Pseudomonas]
MLQGFVRIGCGQSSVRGALLLAIAIGLWGCASKPAPYPFANQPIGTAEAMYAGTLSPDIAVNTYRNIDRLFPSRVIKAGGHAQPLPYAKTPLTDIKFTYQGRAYSLAEFLALDSITGLLVIRDGEIVHESYQRGNTAQTRWMSMSVAKSVTSTLAGIAIQEGRIKGLDAQVVDYLPQLKGTAYDGVSVRNLLMMASGAKWNETATDPTSDRRALLRLQMAQQPGAALVLMSHLQRASAPGTVFNYNTGEAQVLGELVRAATGKPLSQYLAQKVWQPYGMEADATWWLDSPDGTEIGGSGIAATLRDYGRFGMFFMDNGLVDGRTILPPHWVADATTSKTLANGKEAGYGYMWWTASTKGSLQDHAYAAVGLLGQNIYIDPVQKVVIVTFAAQPRPLNKDAINPMVFFDAVVDTLRKQDAVGPVVTAGRSRP